jgi:hypothetical protein
MSCLSQVDLELKSDFALRWRSEMMVTNVQKERVCNTGSMWALNWTEFNKYHLLIVAKACVLDSIFLLDPSSPLTTFLKNQKAAGFGRLSSQIRPRL